MGKQLKRRPSPAMIVAIVALSLSLVGTGAAATISALSSSEKTVVKRIINKKITKRASKLAVAKANNVLAATVPGGDSCTISNQTGGITAAIVGALPSQTCDVTFPRSVSNCSVGATPLHPQQDIGGQASIRYLGGATVRVTRRNGLDNFQAAGLFSIFAVCPA